MKKNNMSSQQLTNLSNYLKVSCPYEEKKFNNVIEFFENSDSQYSLVSDYSLNDVLSIYLEGQNYNRIKDIGLTTTSKTNRIDYFIKEKGISFSFIQSDQDISNKIAQLEQLSKPLTKQLSNNPNNNKNNNNYNSYDNNNSNDQDVERHNQNNQQPKTELNLKPYLFALSGLFFAIFVCMFLPFVSRSPFSASLYDLASLSGAARYLPIDIPVSGYLSLIYLIVILPIFIAGVYLYYAITYKHSPSESRTVLSLQFDKSFFLTFMSKTLKS